MGQRGDVHKTDGTCTRWDTSLEVHQFIWFMLVRTFTSHLCPSPKSQPAVLGEKKGPHLGLQERR